MIEKGITIENEMESYKQFCKLNGLKENDSINLANYIKGDLPMFFLLEYKKCILKVFETMEKYNNIFFCYNVLYSNKSETPEAITIKAIREDISEVYSVLEDTTNLINKAIGSHTDNIIKVFDKTLKVGA